MTLEDIKLHLPQYLSTPSMNALKDALKSFPTTPAQGVYTLRLAQEPILFQGDGLSNFLIVELPNCEKKHGAVLIFSNTCDIAPDNARLFPSNIVYTPIIDLDKYVRLLKSQNISEEKIRGHVESIKNQLVTQILYLPAVPNGRLNESIVFLDTVLNIAVQFVDLQKLKEQRLFTLSDYGHYLFLFKLSFHFTRIQDKVDRGAWS